MSMKEIKPRPHVTQYFVDKHLICSKCKQPMELDDRDKWNGITTLWFVCPCGKESTVITTNKNHHIIFPIEIHSEDKVIKTITKDEVMR